MQRRLKHASMKHMKRRTSTTYHPPRTTYNAVMVLVVANLIVGPGRRIFIYLFFLSFGVFVFYENCLWNWEASELCERLIFILRASLLCVYNFIVHIRHPNIESCKRRERKILGHICLYFCTFNVHTFSLLRANRVFSIIFGGIHTHTPYVIRRVKFICLLFACT